jgi:hypothetical protein
LINGWIDDSHGVAIGERASAVLNCVNRLAAVNVVLRTDEQHHAEVGASGFFVR